MTDPTLELREIKPAIEIAETIEPTWPVWATVASVLLGLAIASVALWRWRHRRLSKQEGAKEIALRELALLSKLELPADNYAMEISAILRRYIEARFAIAATQQTSEEFLQGLSSGEGDGTTAISQAQRAVLTQFLAHCDESKFACGQLDQDQRQDLQQAARSFVQTTSQPAGNRAANPVGDPSLQPSH